jgi:hypothetical protein
MPEREFQSWQLFYEVEWQERRDAAKKQPHGKGK